jgi:hypothetical protein
MLSRDGAIPRWPSAWGFLLFHGPRAAISSKSSNRDETGDYHRGQKWATGRAALVNSILYSVFIVKAEGAGGPGASLSFRTDYLRPRPAAALMRLAHRRESTTTGRILKCKRSAVWTVARLQIQHGIKLSMPIIEPRAPSLCALLPLLLPLIAAY